MAEDSQLEAVARALDAVEQRLDALEPEADLDVRAEGLSEAARDLCAALGEAARS